MAEITGNFKIFLKKTQISIGKDGVIITIPTVGGSISLRLIDVSEKCTGNAQKGCVSFRLIKKGLIRLIPTKTILGKMRSMGFHPVAIGKNVIQFPLSDFIDDKNMSFKGSLKIIEFP